LNPTFRSYFELSASEKAKIQKIVDSITKNSVLDPAVIEYIRRIESMDLSKVKARIKPGMRL